MCMTQLDLQWSSRDKLNRNWAGHVEETQSDQIQETKKTEAKTVHNVADDIVMSRVLQ